MNAVQLGLRSSEIAPGFSGPRGIFFVVSPRDAKRDAGVEFAGYMLSVVVSLRLYGDRGIWNPLAAGEAHFLLLGLHLRLRRANLWAPRVLVLRQSLFREGKV